jgi:hypothetical protein
VHAEAERRAQRAMLEGRSDSEESDPFADDT